ncbi:MAG: stage II sporulation protein P [Lachnospiraceae bacterium]|nr:stage II sporulation protein P [Lachnospiraceae bacterium]
MERIYRETTLRKKRLRIKYLAGSLVLGLVLSIVSGMSDSIWSEVTATGTNCIQPAIIKFQNAAEEEEGAPLLIRLLVPKIFAYTWKEEVPAFAIIEVKKEPVVQQNNSTTFRFVLSGEDELSLLQENLYVEGSEVFVENSHFELFDGDVEQVLQIEELDVHQNYNFAQYSDMTQLIKDFYVIDASTSPDADLLDVDALNGYDCTIDKESAGPQILIYHSHSQEGFADSIPGDASTTIVGAGEKLTRLLEEEYGFDVLHHTGVYDYPSRDEAYSNALPAIEQVLEENPTIQVVIDLHRDAVAEGTKLVTTIDGKDYARFMFFNGICRSTKGPITYLNNPYLKENLAFSFQSQVIAESYFPGITRKIYLKAWRYNMHFKPRNMLIELGAQTNTVEEIMNTTEILAFVIDEVLSRQ